MVNFKKSSFFSILFVIFTLSSFAGSNEAPVSGEGATKETFDFNGTINHHLFDSYEWEFFDKPDGSKIGISLPRIIIDGGLKFFASTEKAEEAGYVDAHEFDQDQLHGMLLKGEAEEELEALVAKKETLTGNEVELKKVNEEIKTAIGKYSVWDFSISKSVAQMMIVALILLVLFISIAKAYKKREGMAPAGVQSFFEPIIEFVRIDIAKEVIGHKGEKYVPMLLSMFFFIWFLNMFGMMPLSVNVTGNISVTLALSVITLIVTNVSANAGYWKHLFWPPVPHAVKPIIVPLEVMGIFTKPFALTIRLFANMTAGHVMAVSLVSLIFIFGKLGEAPGTGWAVGVASSFFSVAIGALEMFVAILQAYIFCMLTSVFISQAIVEEEHH